MANYRTVYVTTQDNVLDVDDWPISIIEIDGDTETIFNVVPFKRGAYVAPSIGPLDNLIAEVHHDPTGAHPEVYTLVASSATGPWVCGAEAEALLRGEEAA